MGSGGGESSQARVPVMRDDIDSWSRPRLAERLSVVGLRAHVAGDARPQLTRRGDDDGEEHHGGEERPGAAWARSSSRSGHGHGMGRIFSLSGQATKNFFSAQSRQTRPVKRPPSLEAPLQASLSLSCATLARPCRCALPPNRRAPPPNTPTRRAARHPSKWPPRPSLPAARPRIGQQGRRAHRGWYSWQFVGDARICGHISPRYLPRHL